MRILLVPAPPRTGDHHLADTMLRQAFYELAVQQPAHEWLVLPPAPATKWALFPKQREAAAIKETLPDLVVFQDTENIHILKHTPAAVLLTDKWDEKQASAMRRKWQSIKLIITHSNTLKAQAVQASGIPEERIKVVPLAAAHISVDAAARENIRERFTHGKEFFFYPGPVQNGTWERILQAFSQFKKWQQSGFLLVLSGRVNEDYEEEFKGLLNTYKYRQDVVPAGDVSAEVKDQLAASAFALITPCQGLQDRQHIIDAMRNGVPVITEKNSMATEVGGEAALQAAWNDPAEISQQLIRLYKDEALYNNLVQQGTGAALQFHPQQMLSALSQALLSAAQP